MSAEKGMTGPTGAELDASVVQQSAVDASKAALQQERDEAVMQVSPVDGSSSAETAVNVLQFEADSATLDSVASTRYSGETSKDDGQETGLLLQAVKRPDGMLDVRKTSTVQPDKVKTTGLFGPFDNGRRVSTTTEAVAPAKGLGIRGVPNMRKAKISKVSSVQTAHKAMRQPAKEGESSSIPDGQDTVFTEEINTPTGRTVTRKTRVGFGDGNAPVLETTQVTKDKKGNVVRENTWSSTIDKPSDVAVRVASAVGARTTKAQPGDSPIRIFK